jgi:hypothetical protein
MIITSAHPALTFVMNNLRFMIVMEEKTKKQNTNNISAMIGMNGFISFSASTGLSISGADQAQNAIASDKKITVKIIVMTVDLIISLLSGISSLKDLNTDLNNVRILVHS